MAEPVVDLMKALEDSLAKAKVAQLVRDGLREPGWTVEDERASHTSR